MEVLYSSVKQSKFVNHGQILPQVHRGASSAPANDSRAPSRRDAERCRAVFSSGDRLGSVRLMRRLNRMFSPADSFEVLRRACTDKVLAPVAILEMGKLVRSVPAARDFLIASLADARRSGSAATALASARDPEALALVARLLTTSDCSKLQSKAVTVLMLDASPLARRSLKRFASRGDAPPQLCREIRQWLNV